MVTPNDRGLSIAVESSDPTGTFIPTRERPCQVMRERGVYLSDIFDVDGNPMVYAVDSRHRVAQRVVWRPGETYEEVVRAVKRWLDAIDPIGPRRVVD